jgi:hypothetical protein
MCLINCFNVLFLPLIAFKVINYNYVLFLTNRIVKKMSVGAIRSAYQDRHFFSDYLTLSKLNVVEELPLCSQLPSIHATSFYIMSGNIINANQLYAKPNVNARGREINTSFRHSSHVDRLPDSF